MGNDDRKKRAYWGGRKIFGRKMPLGRLAAVCISLCMMFEQMPTFAGMWGVGVREGNLGAEPNTSVGSNVATGSNATENDLRTATASNSMMAAVLLEDLWEGRIGDLSFLSGDTGTGTEEKPYQISTRAQLMGLADLASRGMSVEEGGGIRPGNYEGAYFQLSRDIDLGGMEWLPIGYYRTRAEMDAGQIHAFRGHFDGNGKTIANYRMPYPSWDHIGLFGAVEDSEIKDLTLKPGNVLSAKSVAGLLAGSAKRSRIYNITVTGTMKTSGTAGGVAGELSERSVVENVISDHVAIDGGREKETFIGGIAGKASDSVIVDCVVNTGDSLTARLMGGGYVGGITGFQNSADLFNVHVMGTVGGSGSQGIGGVTGKYAGGQIKVGRFEGTIASSGLGSAAREGTFMGTRDPGFHFRYGTAEGADVAYLFADSEAKISAGICGSGISDDNRYTYDAHIGYWHRGDNHFTLVQGSQSKPQGEQYFYEELENGMLHIIDTEEGVREFLYQPDHFAPNALGRPSRGYLASVLQIDTAANVQNYYDVAVLSARGSSAYSRELDKSHRGAIAAGDVVTVTTAPKNTPQEKYQMEGTPTYTEKDGTRRNTTYQAGGSYTFKMPECDTEISAVYKKVAAGVQVSPEEFLFKVVQERSGDRKHPGVMTEVRDRGGKLIARYINGELEQGTQVQEVRIEAVVDKNNDVADSRIAWSIDDDELIHLKRNGDEDAQGYTDKSASLELNLNAGFFTDIITKAEKEQAEKGYRYPISDTIYGSGAGGVAVLTAETRPSASFEGKPLSANSKISVTFQIKDRTKVAAENAGFDKEELEFQVTRTLTGDRKNPVESITVTEPQTLTASFQPDHFDKKDVSWASSDPNVIRVDAGGFGAGDMDYKNALVIPVGDAKWIQDMMASDDGIHRNDPYVERTGSGVRKTVVTVAADDMLGNRQTASCGVTVRFQTVDKTEILPEEIQLSRSQMEIPLLCKKAGDHRSETVEVHGFEEQILSASVFPELKRVNQYEPFNRNVVWSSSDPAVSVHNGKIRPDQNAEWIRAAMEKAPYHGEKTVIITAAAEGRPEVSATCEIKLYFDMECLELDLDQLEFDLTLTKTGRRGSPVLTWDGVEEKRLGAVVYPLRQSVGDTNLGSGGEGMNPHSVVWMAEDEILALSEDGTVKPVTDSPWIAEAMKKYPYTGETKTFVSASADGMETVLPVTLKFRMVDKTYTSSGSGSSSKSSMGSSQSSGITASKPAGSVTGAWTRDEAGNWMFTGEGRTYKGEWAYVHNPYATEGQPEAAWFRFDQNGYMLTGWYQNTADGGWYYLNPVSDGTRGMMCTGWQKIGEHWYWLQTIQDGNQGRMMTGWNRIGGKWYFLDPSDGHLLVNTVTPDGYTVDGEGAWIVNGNPHVIEK